MCVVSMLAAYAPEFATSVGILEAGADAGATFGTIMADVSLLGTGLSTVGTMATMSAQNASAEAQAQVLENNRKMAEIESEDVDRQKQEDKIDLARKISATKGEQSALQGASGLVIGEGTALTELQDTAQMGAHDLATIDENANKEKWSLRQEAKNYTGQATAMRASKSSPLLAGSGSLLSGVGSVASKWYKQ